MNTIWIPAHEHGGIDVENWNAALQNHDWAACCKCGAKPNHPKDAPLPRSRENSDLLLRDGHALGVRESDKMDVPHSDCPIAYLCCHCKTDDLGVNDQMILTALNQRDDVWVNYPSRIIQFLKSGDGQSEVSKAEANVIEVHVTRREDGMWVAETHPCMGFETTPGIAPDSLQAFLLYVTHFPKDLLAALDVKDIFTVVVGGEDVQAIDGLLDGFGVGVKDVIPYSQQVNAEGRHWASHPARPEQRCPEPTADAGGSKAWS